MSQQFQQLFYSLMLENKRHIEMGYRHINEEEILFILRSVGRESFVKAWEDMRKEIESTTGGQP
jgi:hypothetical protein